MDVHVTAQQFSFTYTYPSGKIAPGGILVLPVGRPVKLSVTSKDVDHDWWVPSLAPKIDALPGRTNYVGFTPNQVGTFVGACAEFCGIGHAGMTITVHVVPLAQWNAKYQDSLT
jgi:cytochrome c oxidase subunit 2